jgi:[acyl-carrier-protein] S-malonyltransferase
MPRTVVLFPGQGAQHVGMAAALCDSSPRAKSLFDQASAILGYDLLQVCVHGPADRLNATDVSQPAIFVASLAALEQLTVTTPTALEHVFAAAGLSLGEYTALAYAGAITVEDGVRIVKARGEAMQAASDATPSGMASIIGLEVGEVESLAAEARAVGTIEIANLLCPGNTVVSGAAAAIEEVCRLAESRGLRAIKLAVAGAFHTKLMQPADQQLAEVLKQVKMTSPRVPVWSNVDAKPHTDPVEIRELLVKQVLSPVRWEESMRALLAAGADQFYEIGPGRVLAGLLKRVNRKLAVVNVLA